MKKLARIFATVLAMALILSLCPMALAATTAKFTDVDSDSSYAEAVEVLTKADIIKGVGGDIFAPDQAVTRAMAITVLGRMAGVEQKDTNKFSDVVNGSWYSGYVGWAEENGIVTSDGAGRYMPGQTLTSEEMKLILSRYAEVVGVTYTADNTSAAILTRGEFAQMVYDVYLLNAVKGTQTVVIEGFDWGPTVTKSIIELNQMVSATSVDAKGFSVKETKQSFDYATFSPAVSSVNRAVTAAYASDAEGNRVKNDSKYITLELYYDADNNGSPYFYDLAGTGMNRLADPYNLEVGLTKYSVLTTANGEKIDNLIVGEVDLTSALQPQLDVDGLDLSGKFTAKDGTTLHYASYVPNNANEGEKRPLLIWLHGMGEGGEDPSIVLLGNEATALLSNEFQSIMGGAYILAPQVNGFWMQYTEEDLSLWLENPGVPSLYVESLMELIVNYVDTHPNIDRSRIIIGGCSNGGYMTMNLIFDNPDYFAAAYPICEAYLDEGITDQQLESIKDLPIWFVYAEDDNLITPSNYAVPTIARLKAMNANIYTSIFEVGGHASWVYFFNNECVDEATSVNMWKWLSEQRK